MNKKQKPKQYVFTLKKDLSSLGIWDYDIRKLDLTRPDVLRWYLERKIEYNDWKAIEYTTLKRYLPELAIDEDKKKFLTNFISWYEHTHSPSSRASQSRRRVRSS